MYTNTIQYTGYTMESGETYRVKVSHILAYIYESGRRTLSEAQKDTNGDLGLVQRTDLQPRDRMLTHLQRISI